MGDEVLKKIILTLMLSLILSSALVAAKNDRFTKNFKSKLIKYDKFFTQIGKKRIGVPDSKIDKVKTPFILTDKRLVIKDGNKTVKVKKPMYILNATFNNKAKVNGQWHKINSEIGDFKLTNIRSNSVIIKNEHSKKELFIRNSDVSKIKFSSK